ncbi:MAG: ATP-binding protein [Acidobacteria bacterium]|nr:MAG: ATP-binding protein [Acidobacteriota bacterium]
MRPRLVHSLLRRRLATSPAVALIGPRQSGKTTLARSLSDVYFDLEQESERLRLDLEWSRVVAGRELVILDEAQAGPEVFPRLRGAIDRDRRRNGRFLLLGSVSPALMTRVSESLAGRLSLIELTPFLWSEVPPAAVPEHLWLTGGFPDGGILDATAFPRWQADYLQLLALRDLPEWGLTARPQQTLRLIRMLAALHGQTWNASQLGRSLGLSYHTVDRYVDYLEGAFLVRRLPSFHANVKKRLVKSPKIFWRDSGVLHSLLNVADRSSLLVQPWVGASWEGFVIEQILGHLSALGIPHQGYYLRTRDGYEIDLVVETEGELWAIEAKLTASPSLADLSRLDKVADLVGATRRWLITQTPRSAGDERRAAADLGWAIERLRRGR